MKKEFRPRMDGGGGDGGATNIRRIPNPNQQSVAMLKVCF